MMDSLKQNKLNKKIQKRVIHPYTLTLPCMSFIQQFGGITTGTLNASSVWKYVYSVKVINPIEKSDYTVQNLRINAIFESIEEIKENLVSTVQDVPSSINQVYM